MRKLDAEQTERITKKILLSGEQEVQVAGELLTLMCLTEAGRRLAASLTHAWHSAPCWQHVVT